MLFANCCTFSFENGDAEAVFKIKAGIFGCRVA
jgi:hypothetical protein